MTARATFKQDDVSRAIKGATAGGLRVTRVEVSPIDGKIVIVTDEGATAAAPNPWDDDAND